MTTETGLYVRDPTERNVLAGLDSLPTDLILHICSYLPDWRNVLALLRVSPVLYRLYEQREIWSLLVSSFLDMHDAPRIHYLDHPVYSYTGLELRQTFMRWNLAKVAWRDGNNTRNWGTTSKSTVSAQRIPGGCRTLDLLSDINNWSFLSPGGRWLIILTGDVAAVYCDLDSGVDVASPEQCILFASQISQQDLKGLVHISRSPPEAHSNSPLKFRFAVTFSSSTPEGASLNCTLQIWEVSVMFDGNGQCDSHSRRSHLSAKILASLSFSPLLAQSFISVKALSGSNVVVDIPELRQGPETTCLSIIDWSTCLIGDDNFRRRVILFSEVIHDATLVGSHHLLLTSGKGIFLYDFRRIKIVRAFFGKGTETLVDPHRNMTCTFIAHGEFHFTSRPTTVHTSDAASSENIVFCDDTGQMYLVSISPPELARSVDEKDANLASDSDKDKVDYFYLGNSPARKAFKKQVASTTIMCLGTDQGVILEQLSLKSGGTYMQLSVVYYEREALDRLAKSVNDDFQNSLLGGGMYDDYVIGQVLSRDVPVDFGRPLRPSECGEDLNPFPPVLLFDESIARVVLKTHGRTYIIDL